MTDLCRYARHPFRFLGRYIAMRRIPHAIILAAVLLAVACSVSTQYGVKILVDALAGGPGAATAVWYAFLFLVTLIAIDNLSWRLASWIANSAFVGVTGDLRRDLFRHLTAHAPSARASSALPASSRSAWPG